MTSNNAKANNFQKEILSQVSRIEQDRGRDEYIEQEKKDREEESQWNTAKRYTSEVKEGLAYITSKIPDNETCKSKAEQALKTVFFDLGISCINKNLLDNIIDEIVAEEDLNRVKRERALEKMKREREQLGTEDDLIDELYQAVKKSNLNRVDEILSYKIVSDNVFNEHKDNLIEISKSRGDKKLLNRINKYQTTVNS